MVATYTQPDYTAQSAAAYKANIDAATAVLAEVAQNFAPHEAGTPDMTVVVDAGKLFKPDGTLTTKAQQTTGTITAPAGNPRTDRVVVDVSTGVISVVTGTEAASPTAPAVPAGKMPLCQVALQTSTTQIANSLLTDERAYVLRTPMLMPTQEVSATGGEHTVGAADGGKMLLVDATLGPQTVWLPDAAAAGKGFVLGVKKTDSGSDAVTAQVSTTGDAIDGSATVTLASQNAAVIITCDGAEFHVAAEKRVAATQAQMEAGTSNDVFVPPGRQHNHPSAAKMWCYVDRNAGTPSLSSPSYNMDSVTDDGNGQTIVTVATDFSTAVYPPGAQAIAGGASVFCAVIHTLAAGSFKVYVFQTDNATAQDTTDFTCWAFGDQA